MRLGHLVGYAVLGLVDALVPAAIGVCMVFSVGFYADSSVFPVAVSLAAAVLGIGSIAGAISASRGGKPFPLTRHALRLWKRYWWV